MLAAGVAGAGLIAYLTLRPAEGWLLWLTVGLVSLAVDGLVRGSARWEDDSALASVIYIVLPALAVLGTGLFIDSAVQGYARPISGLAGAVVVGAVVLGEYHTVDYGSRLYGPMRLTLAIATYLTAFALFTVIFGRNVPLAVSGALIGLVSLALAVELLRESRLLGPSSLLAGLAIGLSLAELRLAFYFFPLDDLLAGALLIIGFYLATGLVHHLLDHDLELGTTAEYLLVATVATAAVVFTRVVV
jgi:hypothetical protein